ncbi:mas-related G-protein coupled receptor member H-like [Candoia aspera]|uniref:mas-related G-protein coupled receptor member H-like n=1 Tax=Candoia aspera TaxID=51853 RepID=UPI002FD7BFF5
MNSSLGDRDAFAKYYGYHNTNDSYRYAEKTIYSELGWIILICLILITCCTGFVGNGYVIWLLGFQIKRNAFTTFVLNLAIADFGFLILTALRYINKATDITEDYIFNFICAFFYQIMYINSHFLLTAISIDRCVSVLFPIWHRCSQPKYLSPAVCALLWIFSFLLGGIHNIMLFMGVFEYYHLPSLHYLVTAVLCLPSIAVSTVILFIKIGLKSKQKKRGRLLLMILITLLCYLILAFPLNVSRVLVWHFRIRTSPRLPFLIIMLCSCLNSSINPVIYFLFGRRKQAQSKEGLKIILQKVFKEGEAPGATEKSSNPAPLHFFLRNLE